ncbi:NHL repeat-containing protein [Streptomyces halobius]|uniref:Uncharacterized protein n=1 Tax=Streptomyces halobius TaxID=2879846 RepID=A0ABY4M106_9ACTN|nr:hypothetical protein [Streptomyces halobius]UQA91449.1 hypothetical protein K9S39_05760 [Streptomyces halobius]
MDLTSGARREVASKLGDINDVALDGNGTPYVADYSGGRLLRVDLSDGSPHKVASVTGAYGVALDGTGKAYIADRHNGHLHEVDLADGAWRVVATGLGKAMGVGLEHGNGQIYVSNQAGELWRISQRAFQGPGNVVKAPTES